MDCDKSLSEAKTIQDVPKILSPELRDIFPIFASMLDIKSFMKLAMTSKDMYKRCMEDKSIKINVNENIAYGDYCYVFHFNSSVVSEQFTDTYLSTLKKLRCTVNLQTFAIRKFWTSYIFDSARRYLAEIGVKKIEKLSISGQSSTYFVSAAMILFIKDFHVNIVVMHNVQTFFPVLRTLLQLNLREFSYGTSLVAVHDLLCKINSPIPKISFTGTCTIQKEKFMQILWTIQSGSLTHLTLDFRTVDWRAYDSLPFDHEGPIPEDSPLLFKRAHNIQFCEYWFLHWQGGVTKCVADNESRTLEVFKCEPNDFPVALRKEEDVMKDLTQMRSGVSCHLKHFRTFSEVLTMVDPSMKGPLPTERPLYFKASKKSFWRLDESDNLMECLWENGCAIWRPFIARRCLPFSCPALAKFLFWKLLKEKTDSPFTLCCKSQEEFDSWFEDCKSLDYDYAGPPPNDRPLVFTGQGHQIRYILFDDVWFETSYADKEVHVEQYRKWHQPEITHKTIKEILQNTSSHCVDACVNIRVSLKTFRDGLKLFEAVKRDYGPFVVRSMRQIDGVLTDECWYIFHGVMRKVVWSEGHLTKSPCLLRECSIEIMKMLFKKFATQRHSPITMFLELEQFRSCLEQFTVIPFDFSGPLKIDFPLVFVKEEIRHTCDDGKPHCQCSDVAIHVRFLWDHMISTHCSWGEEETGRIVFKKLGDRRENMPVALKSVEYLKMLLEVRHDFGAQYEWFGEINDFLAFFDGCKKFPFNYKGPLPKERPLVFEDDSDAKEPVRFYLREDNSVVKCKWSMISKRIGCVGCLSHQRSKRLNPPATWNLL